MWFCCCGSAGVSKASIINFPIHHEEPLFSCGLYAIEAIHRWNEFVRSIFAFSRFICSLRFFMSFLSLFSLSIFLSVLLYHSISLFLSVPPILRIKFHIHQSSNNKQRSRNKKRDWMRYIISNIAKITSKYSNWIIQY